MLSYKIHKPLIEYSLRKNFNCVFEIVETLFIEILPIFDFHMVNQAISGIFALEHKVAACTNMANVNFVHHFCGIV